MIKIRLILTACNNKITSIEQLKD